MLRSIIVDDHAPSRNILASYIEKTEGIALLRSFEEPLSALNYLQLNQHVNLIFLDIEMPELSGMDVLHQIEHNEVYGHPMVILTSGHSKYAVPAFKFDIAIGFLEKVYTYGDFMDNIHKAMRLMPYLQHKKSITTHDEAVAVNKDFMFIRTYINCREKFRRVQFDQILYIKGERNYITIHLTTGHFMVRFKLLDIENLLEKNNFVRIHKSYIINYQRVDFIDQTHVQLDNKEVLPISNTYRKNLIDTIGALVIKDS